MKAELVIKNDSINILVNGIVHISINQSKLQGFQSWVGADKYMIEFYLEGNSVICEYDSKEKWVKILKLLSENNLFNRNF